MYIIYSGSDLYVYLRVMRNKENKKEMIMKESKIKDSFEKVIDTYRKQLKYKTLMESKTNDYK